MKLSKILLVSLVVVFGLALVNADIIYAQVQTQEPTPAQKAKLKEAQEKLGRKKVDPDKVRQGKAFGQAQDIAGQGPGGKGDYQGRAFDGSRPDKGVSTLDSVRQPVKPGKVPPVGPARPVDVKKSTAPAAAPQVGVGKSSSMATSPQVDPIKRAQDINRETYERSKKRADELNAQPKPAQRGLRTTAPPSPTQSVRPSAAPSQPAASRPAATQPASTPRPAASQPATTQSTPKRTYSTDSSGSGSSSSSSTYSAPASSSSSRSSSSSSSSSSGRKK